MAGKSLKQQITSWLDSMEPEKKQKTIKVAAICVAILVVFVLYYLSGADKKKPPPPKEQAVGIQLGDSRMEDDIRASYEKSQADSQAQMRQQGNDMQKIKEENTAMEARLAAMSSAMDAMGKGGGVSSLPDPSIDGAAPNDPMAWREGGANGMVGPGTGAGRASHGQLQQGSQTQFSDNGQPAPPPVIEYVGDVSQLKGDPNGGASNDGSKKKGRKFYLPPSFMPAMLLTGLKAKTVESAKGDPEPMMLRIQAPAVLPNEVRAQLEGCLIVAHGYGSLASERVEARLVSISCLDFTGKSMIDASLKGIIVDNDGVKGLAGHPVSKMGANLARLMLAGIAQGAGEAFQQSATTTSVSPLGQTATIDPSQIGRAGLGRGVQNAGNELAKIYAELVRQSSPVIEVGPTKNVTAVVTEGTWLEIKDYESGEAAQQ